MKEKTLPFYLLLLASFISIAQQQKVAPVGDRMQALVNYMDMKVSSDTLTAWTRWVTTGESDAEVNVRNEAWEKFLISFYNNLGAVPTEAVNPQSLLRWSQFITNLTFLGQIADMDKLRQRKGEPKVVSISGEGKQPIILIPPIGFTDVVFEEFERTYSHQFRFIKVNYPGAGSSTPYPFPPKAEYEEARWLNEVREAVIKSVKVQQIQPSFIVAIGSGMFTAMKLAIEMPDKVKGIVCVNGQFITPMASANDRDQNASIDERRTASKKLFPSSLIVKFSPILVTNNFALTSNASLERKYFNSINTDNVYHYFRYNDELQAQDITPALKNFNIPILSLISTHDDLSPQQSNRQISNFWTKLKLNRPELPVSMVNIPDSRNLIFIDQPKLFDYYFTGFINNPTSPVKEITSESHSIVERSSPRAMVSQTVGALDITVTYSRPAVNGRKVWGDLVPYGNVWRAGANEATQIELTQNATVNGHFISKGKYSFFIIPSKEKWTLIFNRIHNQWGAFTYNKRYDTLRLEVKPTTLTQPEEYLLYRFQNLTGDKVDLSLSWADKEISITLEEAFYLPLPPQKLIQKSWTKLLTDEEGDGRTPGMTDGKTLSYYYDPSTDTLWFKFDLYQMPNKKAFALNIIIDEDNDQSTGMNWFGTNTSFTFDKAITLWMRKEGGVFGGVNGVTDISGVLEGRWNKLNLNTVKYYLDPDQKLYIAGVKRTDLQLKSNTIRVLGAVGEYMNWNDDIGDKETAIIKF